MGDILDSSEPTAEKLNELSAEWDTFTQERHEMGAREYGPTAFLENDMFEYIFEELADIANYVRYTYIKLRLLEEVARERGIDMSTGPLGEVRKTDEVPSGPTAFVEVQEVFSFLRATEEGRRLPDSG